MNKPVVFDPGLDLRFEREVDVPAAFLWRGWTDPELLLKWFTPAPWRTVACEIDLRPGGLFATTMRSPEGQEFPGTGCYLEVVAERRLAWTNAMGPGFRPATPLGAAECDRFSFTGVVELTPLGPRRCRYQATVIHADAAGRERHAAMGFEEGWGKALEQLVALYDGASATPAPAAPIATGDAAEAAAFRRLIEHLRTRHDVQNIDLMNLAGFCRNCLADWYREAAAHEGLVLDKDQARERVYGIPHAEWKAKYQT